MWCKWQCRSMPISDDPTTHDVEWRSETSQLDYLETLATMEARAGAIAARTAREMIWLLEHPPLYTAGTSADPAELLDARFPVHVAGRGGRYTYHGPGQRIGYVMIDLARRGRDVRCFVHAVEGWVIAALAQLGLESWRAPGRVGIWTNDKGREAKIGAIGIRIRRWVSFHGFAINLDPDLSHFAGIVPCGLPDYPVTSLATLGFATNRDALDSALFSTFDSFLEAIHVANEKIGLSEQNF